MIHLGAVWPRPKAEADQVPVDWCGALHCSPHPASAAPRAGWPPAHALQLQGYLLRKFPSSHISQFFPTRVKPQPTAAGHKRAFADPDASVRVSASWKTTTSRWSWEGDGATEQWENVKIVPHITPPLLKFLGPDFKIKKNIRTPVISSALPHLSSRNTAWFTGYSQGHLPILAGARVLCIQNVIQPISNLKLEYTSMINQFVIFISIILWIM